MSDLMKVSSNPHIRSKVTTSSIMLAVVIALLPATGFGIYNFGLDALILILVTVASAVLTEYLYEKIMHKPVTIGDFSAVVTGLLLALNLPSTAPWWIGVIGGVFAILVVKMFQNPVVPGVRLCTIGNAFFVSKFVIHLDFLHCFWCSGFSRQRY